MNFLITHRSKCSVSHWKSDDLDATIDRARDWASKEFKVDKSEIGMSRLWISSEHRDSQGDKAKYLGWIFGPRSEDGLIKWSPGDATVYVQMSDGVDGGEG